MNSPIVLDKLAYTLPNFALAVDMSLEAVRQQISSGALTPAYPNSRPLITKAEGERWLASLPSEKP